MRTAVCISCRSLAARSSRGFHAPIRWTTTPHRSSNTGNDSRSQHQVTEWTASVAGLLPAPTDRGAGTAEHKNGGVPHERSYLGTHVGEKEPADMMNSLYTAATGMSAMQM